jgi:multidrug efflux pump subunit AcrA (membrane-fusion protein)
MNISRLSELKYLYACCMAALLFTAIGCHSTSVEGDDEEANVTAQTPVTVEPVRSAALADSIQLNATSSFLQKNFVKANATGYIQQVLVKPGQYVSKGQLLFKLKTKEAQSIGNTINVLDTTFKFSGVNQIKASGSGYITQLAHQAGDYVQDGEQLAVISDRSSFAFLLQLPFELRNLVSSNQHMVLTLPDGEKLNGYVSSIMPSVDTLAQTQSVVIKTDNPGPLPENLIAQARLIKLARSSAPSLPKSAVLSNETQTEFWVMKLLNDTTVVKVSVHKGIESGGRVEILSPKFKVTDLIAITGNYGLSDTAKVKVVQTHD